MIGGDVAGGIEPEVASHGEESGMLAGAVVVELAGLVTQARQGTGACLLEGPVGPALEAARLEPRLVEHAPGRLHMERRASVRAAGERQLGRREAEPVRRAALQKRERLDRFHRRSRESLPLRIAV